METMAAIFSLATVLTSRLPSATDVVFMVEPFEMLYTVEEDEPPRNLFTP